MVQTSARGDLWSTQPLALSSSSSLESARRELAKAGYGHGNADHWLQARESIYPALKGTHFLDCAAAAPAPPAAIQALLTDVTSTMYSNPHSRSTSSVATAQAIDRVRTRVLRELFGLAEGAASSDWDLVFTSGTTAAIKQLGEALPWKSGRSARLSYLRQSHTSLVGLRGIALDRGAHVESLKAEELLGGGGDALCSALDLVAYPAQCSVTGTRFGLDLCRQIKRQRPTRTVLLDAAAYVSTSVLALGSVPLEEAPDFVVCSFYKIFGWPTGLGGLIVKRSAAHLLTNEAYFGGGTVSGLSVGAPFWDARRAGGSSAGFSTVHERLEHGTPPYLDIIALGHAMDTYRRLYRSLKYISLHASSLSNFTSHQLSLIRHANGLPVVQQHRLVGCLHLEPPGPIIGFSLLDARGAYIGHAQLERLATLHAFSIRSGGMCNTGVWTSVMGLSDLDLQRLRHQGRACWDDEEFDGNKPLGLARISFGACSTLEDAVAFIDFIRRFFVDPGVSPEAFQREETFDTRKRDVKLRQLTLYPIKSCAGQSVAAWNLAPTGLEYDREWMLVDPRTSNALSQKRWSRMVLIRPRIDLPARTMTVAAPGMQDLVLPLDQESETCSDASSSCSGSSSEARVCSDRVRVVHVSARADEWFSTFLGTPCELRRYLGSGSEATRHAHFDGPPQPLLLSNESPFLLINSASVRLVNEWIRSDEHEASLGRSVNDASGTARPHKIVPAACFRANIELGSEDEGALLPFIEDEVDLIRIGWNVFQALGPCRRCLMVSIDQDLGIKTTEPFSALTRHRKGPRGRIDFGIHLIWRQDLSAEAGSPDPSNTSNAPRIQVGDSVTFFAS